MNRKNDLETHICASYRLVEQYEGIEQLSDDPKEKARANKNIQEQRLLLERYLEEYLPLCQNLSREVPDDIITICKPFVPKLQTTGNLYTIKNNSIQSMQQHNDMTSIEKQNNQGDEQSCLIENQSVSILRILESIFVCGDNS